MFIVLRSIFAGTGVAGAILVFTVGVLSPYLPQEISRPAWLGTREFQSESPLPLRVVNGRGSVRVETWDQPHIGVRADLRVYVFGSQSSEAARRFGASAVTATVVDGAFFVCAASPPPGLSLRCDLEVLAPRNTSVRIESADGSIRVGAGCGTIFARGLDSDILLVSPESSLDVQTVEGRIILLDSAAQGRVETIAGNIYARVRGGDLEAQTASGFIGVTLLDPKVARCGLTSTNGAITLALAPICRVLVEAQTELGEVRSELVTSPALAAGAHTKAWLGTAVGAAASVEGEAVPCRVTMRTRNGNLSIREGA